MQILAQGSPMFYSMLAGALPLKQLARDWAGCMVRTFLYPWFTEIRGKLKRKINSYHFFTMIDLQQIYVSKSKDICYDGKESSFSSTGYIFSMKNILRRNQPQKHADPMEKND